MVIQVERFDVFLVKLNPAVGSEIRKTRPAVVVSPDEINDMGRVIIAPMTTKGFGFIFRVKIKFEGENGLILLDQIRTVDKSRLIRKIGKLSVSRAQKVSSLLSEMFQY